jgi:hypothetical protein
LQSFLFWSHFRFQFAISSAESNFNANDATQSVKEEHRTRFNTGFNAWFASKKQPTIKSDETYAEIINAVEKWADGDRFKGDITNYNYGSR